MVNNSAGLLGIGEVIAVDSWRQDISWMESRG